MATEQALAFCSTTGVLFVVIGEETLERIRNHDPFIMQFPTPQTLHNIVIAYEPVAKFDVLSTMTPAELHAYTSRGVDPGTPERVMSVDELPWKTSRP